jgi:predicted MFS family arabinose efflux permease
MRAFGSLGWVVGLTVAAGLLTVWPDHVAWVLLAAAALALSAPRSWGTRTRTPGTRRRAVLPLPAVLRVLAFTFPAAVVISGLVQFIAGWARQVLDAGPFLALTPIALSAALELPAFPWVDRLAHRHPPLLLAVLACPPLAVAAAGLAYFPSSVMMLAVQPLVAASFALWFVGQSRMLAGAAEPSAQATAQTLGSALSFGFGSLLAGAAGGRLAEAAGYGTLFGVLGGLALVGALSGAAALAWRRRAVAGTMSLR